MRGLKLLATTMLCGSLLVPSVTFAQTIPVVPGGSGSGGIGGAVSSILGGDRATRTQQFAQIALATQQLNSLLQAVESLQLGAELIKIFEQMFQIQGVVEDVMNYEVPEEHLREYDIIDPIKGAAIARERKQYLKEIDAEIAGMEREMALNPDQFATLTSAAAIINEPRSGSAAIQAQFVADQSALEHQRRAAAIELLKAKRADIKEQISVSMISLGDAMSACFYQRTSTEGCDG